MKILLVEDLSGQARQRLKITLRENAFEALSYSRIVSCIGVVFLDNDFFFGHVKDRFKKFELLKIKTLRKNECINKPFKNEDLCRVLKTI